MIMHEGLKIQDDYNAMDECEIVSNNFDYCGAWTMLVGCLLCSQFCTPQLSQAIGGHS